MISRELAEKLKAAGLPWEPKKGDWFVAWEDNCPRSNPNVDGGVEILRAYCYDDGEYTWVYTKGWNDAGVAKLLKCRAVI